MSFFTGLVIGSCFGFILAALIEASKDERR